MKHAQIFDMIYERNLWQHGSGLGSTEANTKAYRWFLQSFLRTNRIRSVLDLGCGDWQFSKLMDWTGIDYTGLDVSAFVLKNTALHARPGVRFIQGDAVTGDLPAADILIAKDVLQHWSNADILAFLPKLAGFRMALITNGFHPAGLKSLNSDIGAGNWRPVDLCRPPFDLAANYVFWFDGGEPKSVLLWVNPAPIHAPVKDN